MSVADWVSPVLSFVGGGLGAALAYRSAKSTDEQTDKQSRREEWGRRFTAALEGFTAGDSRSRTLGRTMLVQLLESELATEDDRQLALRLLESDASRSPDVRRILEEGIVTDDLDFVQHAQPAGEEET